MRLAGVSSVQASHLISQESSRVLTKHWVAIFLMMLVALQSVAVAADVHRFYQSQHAHLELGHSAHADPHHVDSHHGSESERITDNCPHCCHCHGSFCAVFSSHSPALFVDQSQTSPAYRAAFSSPYTSTLFRPPKA